MSIAMSALLRPSCRLRLLHGLLCGGVCASAICCPGPAWAAACLASGLAGWMLGRGKPNPRRIDISHVGSIRLTVYQQTGDEARGAPLALLAGSTLWPSLLLLCLGGDGRPEQRLLILPDAVAGPAWRHLALACRALAARGGGEA